MKKRGSVSDFGKQRNEELKRAFQAQLHLIGEIPTEELFTRAARMPASRFWVSERRAAEVMSKMLKGDRLQGMNPKKREMYMEIFLRVREHLRREPCLTVTEATFRAVNSQAPEFYLTPKSARVIIYRIRGLWKRG